MYTASTLEVIQLNELKQKLFNLPLNFSTITVNTIEGYLADIKKLTQATYDTIARLPTDQITFKTVIQPLIDLDVVTQTANTLCTFPRQVHLDKEVREASLEAQKILGAQKIDYNQREDVYKVFQQYVSNYYQDEKEKLHPEDIQYVKQIKQQYKRMGMALTAPEKKQQIIDIKKKINKLCLQYSQNLNENKASVFLSENEVQGLPKNWLDNHKCEKSESDQPQYKVTLQEADVVPIFGYATNRWTREKILLAYGSRCEKENLPLLKKILLLQTELAQLLGYTSYADYLLEDRMAKDAKTVKNFLDDLNKRFTPVLEKNLADLTSFARDSEQDPNFILQRYDTSYYKRLREEKLCSINMQSMKEYFPLETVVQGTFTIFAGLLNLRFEKNNKQGTWHDDVQCFDVFDKHTDEKLGQVYLDLFAREGKYSHVAAFALLCGGDISPITHVPKDRYQNISALLCNFPKNDNLTFLQMRTFFHEFGHVMHFICSKTKLVTNHASSVKKDLIEAPSQMLENWCYEPAALKLLSAHVVSKQPLPKETAEKLIEKDLLHAGFTNKFQLMIGYYSYALHDMSIADLEALDLKAYSQQTQMDILQLPRVNDAFLASFPHLVNEYEAGYYGYLWALVYAADMYATIFKSDPFSSSNGAKYRQCILEPGASLDPNVLLTTFLGRKPTIDAFMEKIGLNNGSRKGLYSDSSVSLLFKSGQTATSTTAAPSKKIDSTTFCSQ